MNSRLCNRAPGALHAGTTREKKRRFVASTRDSADPDRLWTLQALRLALTEVVDEINTTVQVRRLGGATRLDAYAADPTAQRFVSDTELRAAMLVPSKGTYRATKNGIYFDREQYVGVGLHVGSSYQVRHLPNERDFIEVFTPDGKDHVARAWRSDRMPEKERLGLLAERARVERENRAVEAGAIHFRDRVAAAGKALAAAAGHDPDTDVPPEHARPTARSRARSKRPADTPAVMSVDDGFDVDALTDLYGDTLPDA